MTPTERRAGRAGKVLGDIENHLRGEGAVADDGGDHWSAWVERAARYRAEADALRARVAGLGAGLRAAADELRAASMCFPAHSLPFLQAAVAEANARELLRGGKPCP